MRTIDLLKSDKSLSGNLLRALTEHVSHAGKVSGLSALARHRLDNASAKRPRFSLGNARTEVNTLLQRATADSKAIARASFDDTDKAWNSDADAANLLRITSATVKNCTAFIAVYNDAKQLLHPVKAVAA